MSALRSTIEPRADGRSAAGTVQRSTFHVQPRLKVLFVGGTNVFRSPGGGETQLLKTAEYLRPLGSSVDIVAPAWDGLEGADVVHFFGMHREFLPLVRRLRARGIPTALSTIAWSDLRSTWHTARNWRERLAHSARYAIKTTSPYWPTWRRKLLQAADLILPNSRAEALQLVRKFAIDPGKIRVVPNGADPRFADADAALFVREFGMSDFILLPGRVEPRKNQLTAVRALRDVGRPVVVLGDPAAGHADYYRAVKSEAGAEARFLARLDHDSHLLASAYAASACTVLASWFETPGLAALEAALAGSRLVLTPCGATTEYFGSLALYADPNRPEAIRRAVETALGQPRSPRLRQVVWNNYLWQHAARKTRLAYQRLVGQPACGRAGAALERHKLYDA